MAKYSLDFVKSKLEPFCVKFDKYRLETISEAKEYGVRLQLYASLSGAANHFVCLVSKGTGDIFIEIKKASKFTIEYHEVSGPVLSFYNQNYNYTMPRMLICGAKFISVGSVNIEKSFHIYDSYADFPRGNYISINNLTFYDRKHGTSKLVEFGLFDADIENFADIDKEKVRNILLSIHREFQEAKPSLEKLTPIFKKLVEDETTTEKQIDDFLSKNPLILEVVLNLERLLSQTLLKDVNKEYGQDLKPDIIGYDMLDKQWKIIDYKRANRQIIKSKTTVRVAFTAEITSLKSQLSTYRSYFDDFNCREDFDSNYGFKIKAPSCIGIIGRVDKKDRDEFNKLKLDLPSWLKIMAYNDIIDYLEGIIARGKNNNQLS